jgi:RimJ/RimL family protein N-acetyltransferase
MAYPLRIEGETARFEQWSFDRHTPAFVELCADPEVMRFLGGPQSTAEAEAVSQGIADRWSEHGFGLWAALDAEDATCLGFSGACRPGPGWDPSVAGEVEVGWRLARNGWGRGIATEGARLAMAALARHLGLPRVVSFVHPENERSLAVTRRLGMRPAGTTVNPHSGEPVLVLAASTMAEAA